MESVAAGAHEPRRGLVGIVVLVASLVVSHHMHFVSGLIERVKLLAEAVEVLAAVGGGSDIGLGGSETVPVGHFVMHHAIAGEGNLRGDYGPGQRLAELNTIGNICDRLNPSEIIGGSVNFGRRRREDDETAEGIPI